jgi:hypothetical protein
VISQAHAEYDNHNGGQVAFGADGLLYVSMGDGGGGNDPRNNAQSLGTLLGKILRIDPRAGASLVPAGNPFAGRAGARPEIWAYGLRNPFRFSFDRATGALWIGDVGQDAREEVDVAAAGAGGQNYGWRCYEGAARNPDIACDAPGHVPPRFDLSHSADGVCSITGGVVVRDAGVPGLAGRYVYGDLCKPEIQSTPGRRRREGHGDRPVGRAARRLRGGRLRPRLRRLAAGTRVPDRRGGDAAVPARRARDAGAGRRARHLGRPRPRLTRDHPAGGRPAVLDLHPAHGPSAGLGPPPRPPRGLHGRTLHGARGAAGPRRGDAAQRRPDPRGGAPEHP